MSLCVEYFITEENQLYNFFWDRPDFKDFKTKRGGSNKNF